MVLGDVEAVVKWSRALNMVANGAILLALGYVVIRPGGIASGLLDARRQESKQRRVIHARWDSLVAAAALLQPATTNPRVTIIEFSDYQCVYCREQHQRFASLLAQHPQVELRLVHFPLPNHRLAGPAARAAWCAEQQGRLVAMHDRLFQTVPQWTDPVDWSAHAQAAGVDDLLRFQDCVEDPETRLRMEKARQLGLDIGIQGTPAFVTRDGLHRGALSDSAFAALLADR